MKTDIDLLPGGDFYNREADFAMAKFAFYKCSKCKVFFLFIFILL